MAKKYKRSASAAQARPGTGTETAAPAADRPVSMFARRGASAEFNPDYTYVINDLKRIGVMSGIFVVILVVLHFILG